MLRPIVLMLVLSITCQTFGQEETPSLNISAQPGFKVELIRAAQQGEDSWISMTFDDQGKILVGLDTQGKEGYLKDLRRYEIKSPGFYIAGSKNYAFLGYLSFHGGVGYNRCP